VICVSSKILALFFFDPVKFGYIQLILFITGLVLDHPVFPARVSNCLSCRTIMSTLYTKHSISVLPSATLSFNPWTSPHHFYLPPYPNRHHLRYQPPIPSSHAANPSKERPHPTSHVPHPNPHHPLSAPEPLALLHSPLSLRVHFQKSS
jgi:hypothetical protein